MLKMKLIHLLISLIISSFCYCQNYSLDNFEECKIPEVGSKEWFEFNHSSDKEYIFTLESGKIKISKYEYHAYSEYNIPEGKLITINQGEFGGGLYYKPKDTTKSFYVNGKNGKDIQPKWFGGLMISERNPISKLVKESKLIQSGNVQFIFSFNDSIYFMGGLAHMSLNFGNLYSLKYSSDSFYINRILNLEDAPSAMYIYGQYIYLAGSKGFYIIDKNFNVKTIFNSLFWYGLYPTSVLVLDEENVFVTIRGGYVKLNPEKKSLKLYKAK